MPVVGRYIVAPLSHNCNHTLLVVKCRKGKERTVKNRSICLSLPPAHPPTCFSVSQCFTPNPNLLPTKKKLDHNEV